METVKISPEFQVVIPLAVRKELHLVAGCRSIRTGYVRIVYRVQAEFIEVLIVAVGPRRNGARLAISGL